MIQRRLPTQLCGRRWSLDDTGTLELGDARRADLERIDAEWPSIRPESDVTRHWQWQELAGDEVETFVLKRDDGCPVAIWVSKKRKPILLEGRLYYRLDNIEVHPQHRGVRLGRLLGTFLVALIAQRALEVGAEGMVLVTWQTHADFYRKLGGRVGAPRGWTVPKDLVPFVFDEATLIRLKEMADEFIAEQ